MGNSYPSKDRLSAPKIRRFELRLSEPELQQFLQLEKSLGISRADIVRIRVLKNSANMLVNAKELMKQLDGIGAKLGRSGNNINQLARHANILHNQGLLSQSVATEFNSLLGHYITVQRELEKIIRQIIRQMKS
ncbi:MULTISPECIES: ribbon-helix-helix domain-containing protein [Olivibacter]|uniref:Plasmid mobilization relaxosome protein MobC n=1 Tax=Olivibacter jilunii TaxID=985016 RepID=A0ABW6B610_9SPHI